MAPTIPTCEPVTITSGDTTSWTKIVADYPPSDGWDLKYLILLAAERVYATVTDDGAQEYTATIDADDADLSAITTATEARLVGFVEGSGTYLGERHTVYDAALTILPNVTKTTLNETRTETELELVAIKATILTLTNGGTSAYAISGHSATKIDLPILYQRQAVLEARVRAEKGLPFRRRLVSFVNG